MRGRAATVLFALAAAATASPPGPVSARAPYDGPPAPNVAVEVSLDLEAAQGLLDLLSAPQFDAEKARALESLPAIAAAIRESKRRPEV